MKKRYLALLLCGVIFATGCGVKQADYDTLESSYESLKGDYDSLKSDHEKLAQENDTMIKEHDEQVKTLENNYNTLESDSNAYKEQMKPFEEMTAAQAEEETIRARQEKEAMEAEEAAAAAAAAEAESAAAAEAEAQRLAEEAKGYETGITYDQLARTPDEFKDQKVKFRGKVIQVMDGTTVNVRIAVNSNYDTVIYGVYASNIVSSRILEDDVVTIYGVSKGLYSYKSTMGGQITIPRIDIDSIEQ